MAITFGDHFLPGHRVLCSFTRNHACVIYVYDKKNANNEKNT